MDLFCNVTARPSYCILKTNLCCCQCKHQVKCGELAKQLKTSRPCASEDFDEDEECQFLL